MASLAHQILEGCHHQGIELCPGGVLHLRHGLHKRQGLAIASGGQHGIHDFSQGQNTCPQRNHRAVQAVRIAASVVALVVMQDQRRNRDGSAHGRHQRRADDWMMPDGMIFGLRQSSRLQEQLLAHASHTDVVQLCGQSYAGHLIGY